MWAFHFQVEVLQFTESTYNWGKTRDRSQAASSIPQDSTQGPPLQSVVALQDLNSSPRLTPEQCQLDTFPGTGIIGDNCKQKA